ncbi:MAG: hypothetical protein ACPGWR_05970 [Ardenticatenaceae bacterium]
MGKITSPFGWAADYAPRKPGEVGWCLRHASVARRVGMPVGGLAVPDAEGLVCYLFKLIYERIRLTN